MRVQDLMSQPAVTCHVNDSLATAAKLMWDRDCGAIAVVRDDGKLTGVITDRDICMAAYTQGKPLEEMLVHSAMAIHVATVSPTQRLGEAEELMAERQVRRLPVVDQDGKPVGMISMNDLAIESVQPDTRMNNGVAQTAHTLAAICTPRSNRTHAA